MSISDTIHEAIRGHHQVLLRSQEDLDKRVVEPHVVHEAANVLVDFYQISGFSSSGNLPGWRRLAISDIAEATILAESFTPRTADGYNPGSKRYARIISRA